MKRLQMRVSGTNKVVDCPWIKGGVEPGIGCVKCNYGSTIDYAANYVNCKFYLDEQGEAETQKPHDGKS